MDVEDKKRGVVWVNNPVVNFGIVRRSNLTKVIYIYFTQKKPPEGGFLIYI
jgi:hypothetical protein